MRLSSARLSIVPLAVGALLTLGLPAATASTVVAAHKPAAVGDRCLIGTWRDNGGTTTTRWNGHTVTMHTRGGDFDHIAASGRDRNTWADSKALVGRFGGHRLTERVRGQNSLLLRATSSATGGTVVETEQGWLARSTNRYVYRGQHSTGYLNQTGSFSFSFRCTLTTLTFLAKGGKVLSSETRLSFEP
jgi:hypothetical protein